MDLKFIGDGHESAFCIAPAHYSDGVDLFFGSDVSDVRCADAVKTQCGRDIGRRCFAAGYWADFVVSNDKTELAPGLSQNLARGQPVESLRKIPDELCQRF